MRHRRACANPSDDVRTETKDAARFWILDFGRRGVSSRPMPAQLTLLIQNPKSKTQNRYASSVLSQDQAAAAATDDARARAPAPHGAHARFSRPARDHSLRQRRLRQDDARHRLYPLLTAAGSLVSDRSIGR